MDSSTARCQVNISRGKGKKIRGNESAGGEGEGRDGREHQSGADMLWSLRLLPLLKSQSWPVLASWTSQMGWRRRKMGKDGTQKRPW